jgi:hypothetical protein
VDNSPSTSSTCRVISDEWAVLSPLVAPVVLLQISGHFRLH